MRLVAWNCCGLGNPCAVRALHELIKMKDPHVVFLSETKLHASRLEGIKLRCAMVSCFAVSAEGTRGGLAMMWKDSFSLKLLSYSSSHIDMETMGTESLRLTGFYGELLHSRRYLSWNLLRSLVRNSTHPWICFDDFNEILWDNEKSGSCLRRASYIQAFRTVLQDCGLSDLGFQGQWYKWERGNTVETNVKERLDRFVDNKEWFEQFSSAIVTHLTSSISDHCPILLETNPGGNPRRGGKGDVFRFESSWVRESGCAKVVELAWNSNTNKEIGARLDYIGRCLQQWSRTELQATRTQIKLLHIQLSALKLQSPSSFLLEKEKELRSLLNKLLQQDELYWKQRSKVPWLQEGDRNSRFFHRQATQRRRGNFIKGLADDHGVWREDHEAMEQVATSYFQQLFSSSTATDYEEVLAAVEPHVNERMSAFLLEDYREEEIKEAIFQMFPTKSPGRMGCRRCFINNIGILLEGMLLLSAWIV